MSNDWYAKHAKDVTAALAKAKNAPQDKAIACTLVKMGDGSHLICANASDSKAAALVKEARAAGGKIISAGSLFNGDKGLTFDVTSGSAKIKTQFAEGAKAATGKPMVVHIPDAGAEDGAAAAPAADGAAAEFKARAARLVAAVKQADKEKQATLQAPLVQAMALAKEGRYADADPLLKKVEEGLSGAPAFPAKPAAATDGEPPPPPKATNGPLAPAAPAPERELFLRRLQAIKPRYEEALRADPPNKPVLEKGMAAAVQAGKDGAFARGLQLLEGLDKAIHVHEAALAAQAENKKHLDELSPIEPEDAPGPGPTAPAMGEQSGAILRRLNEVYNPPAVVPPELAETTPAERKPIDDARQSVLDLLNRPLSADVLKEAKGIAVFQIARLVTQAAEAARARLAGDAQEVRQDAAMTESVADALDDEMKPVAAARSGVTEALKTEPPTAAAVSAAREALAGVKTALADAKKKVQERLDKAAEEILADEAQTAAVADATTEEMAGVTAARQQVTDALKPPRTNAGVASAKDLLKLVGPALDKARQAVAARLLQEAEAIRADKAMTEPVADAIEEDLTDLKAARGNVTSALPDKPTGADVKAAAELLKLVRTALTAAAAKVQTRLKNAADTILAMIAADQPLGKNPDGASAKQAEALTAARTAVRAPLTTEPRTAALLKQGETARDALDKLHKAIQAAVARLGGAAKAKELYAAVGEDKVNALAATFAAEDPEKLAALLTDLGGKDALVKLAAAYPSPADLKTASDTLGGPKGVEAALRIGGNGDADKVKKLLGAFTGPQNAQLKNLVEKGGMKGRPEVLGHLLATAFTAESEKALRAKNAARALGAPLYTALDAAEQETADDKAQTQMKNLAAALAAPADQARLAALLDAGGLAANPAALGALLQAGFGGDAAKLKTLVGGYEVPSAALVAQGNSIAKGQQQKLDDLKGVLTRGGLGERPEVFAHLVGTGCGGNPAELKTFCQVFRSEADQDRLRTLARGGLGGSPGESPARLGAVFKEGFAGGPEDRANKLKALHGAYTANPPLGADLADLKTTLDAFDSEPPKPPPSHVGRRLKRVTARLGDPLSRLQTDFYDGVAKGTRAGAARAAQDRLGRDTVASLTMTRLARAEALAAVPTATAETKAAAVAARSAAEAAAAAVLAGANANPANANMDALAKAARRSATAARRAAELGADPKAAGDAVRARLREEIKAANAELTEEALAGRVNAAATTANQDARNAKQQATLAMQQATANPTPANIRAAALAAKQAVAKAALATDEAVIKEVLTASAAVAKSAADAAAQAAGRAAQSKADAKSAAALAELTGSSTNWADAEKLLKGAGEARLLAVVAGSAPARKAAVKAAEAETQARAVALDPAATADEIEAARQAARAAAKTAANEAAKAAAAEATRAAAAIGTASQADRPGAQAAALAAADAASAAALAADDPDKTTALTNATAAYDAAVAAGRNVPAGPNTRRMRTLTGAALFQKEKLVSALANGAAEPLSWEKLLRVGSDFEKAILPNPDHGVKSGAGALPARDAGRMDHYCGRHTQECFTFGPHELPPSTSAVLEAYVVEAENNGSPLNAYQIKQIAHRADAKVTTFFPPGVKKDKVAQYVKEAVAAVNAGGGTADRAYTRPVNRADINANGGLQVKHVPVSDGLRVTVAFGYNPGNASGVKVMQCYPEPPHPDLVTVSLFEMHALKSAGNL